MKRLIPIILTIVVSATFMLGFFHANISQSQMIETAKEMCPFSTAIDMNITDCPIMLSSYFETWTNFFIAVLPTLLLLCVVIIAIYSIRAIFYAILNHVPISQNTKNKQDYLITLFAKGILHPKRFKIV